MNGEELLLEVEELLSSPELFDSVYKKHISLFLGGEEKEKKEKGSHI